MKIENLIIVISIIVILLFLSSCTNWSVSYTGDYCSDSLQDRTETDVDCGGLYCDPCEEGYACEGDSDCSSEYCESGLCATEAYDATTADSDDDGVVDVSDVCDGEDDTIDLDEDEIADCVDDEVSTSSNIVFVGASYGSTWGEPRDETTFYALDAEDGSLIWSAKLGSLGYTTFPEQDGVVYVHASPNLYALDAKTGLELWNFEEESIDSLLDVPLLDSKDSSPAIYNNILYMGSRTNYYVYAINTYDGSEVWKFETGSTVLGSPIIADDVVYVGAHDYYFYAIDASNGNELWKYETTGWINFAPSITESTVYVTSRDGYLYALNKEDGIEIWKKGIGASATSPLVYEDAVYVNTGNSIYALNANDGSELWQSYIGTGSQSSIAIGEGLLYVSGGKDEDKALYALNLDDGLEVWKYEFDENVYGTPLISNGIIYVGTNDGYLYALDAETGVEVWKYYTDNVIYSTPSVYLAE